MIAHPLPSSMGLDAAEDVKAGLEPLVEAVSYFERLMLSVVSGSYTVNNRLLSFCSEVAVQFHHGVAGGDSL
jgi:hypothetical protein